MENYYLALEKKNIRPLYRFFKDLRSIKFTEWVFPCNLKKFYDFKEFFNTKHLFELFLIASGSPNSY